MLGNTEAACNLQATLRSTGHPAFSDASSSCIACNTCIWNCGSLLYFCCSSLLCIGCLWTDFVIIIPSMCCGLVEARDAVSDGYVCRWEKREISWYFFFMKKAILCYSCSSNRYYWPNLCWNANCHSLSALHHWIMPNTCMVRVWH